MSTDTSFQSKAFCKHSEQRICDHFEVPLKLLPHQCLHRLRPVPTQAKAKGVSEKGVICLFYDLFLRKWSDCVFCRYISSLINICQKSFLPLCLCFRNLNFRNRKGDGPSCQTTCITTHFDWEKGGTFFKLAGRRVPAKLLF